MAIPPPSAAQSALLSQLASGRTEFRYDWDRVRGGLAFARADSLHDTVGAVAEGPNGDPARTAQLEAFLARYGALFNLGDGLKGVSHLRSKHDPQGFAHLHYQQYAQAEVERGPGAAARANADRGIEVYGSKLVAHFAPDGRLVEVQSSCIADPRPDNAVKVKQDALGQRQLRAIRELPGFERLAEQAKRREERLFPLMQEPRLVLYPWQDRLLLAWATYGYGHLPKEEQENPDKARDMIAFGQMFFDAETGKLFLFAPTRKGAETATTGSGLGTLPLGGPFASRPLDIVRVDSSSTYRLKNLTKARRIITYDANANSGWVYPNIPSHIDNGDIPVSEDTDGDHNWSRTAADTTDGQRTASQQPEVDEHATVAELYDWYTAIGGRVGWDDNGYTAPLVPNQDINVVAHTYDGNAGTSRSINAFFDQELVSGHWVSHLAFFDGDPTASEPYDYLAGSKAIVGHEYQHAVTDFCFIDCAGNPGLTYSDWFAAAHEGLSDVFGCLFSGNWWMGNDISPTGEIFRNVAFPRDSTCFDPNKFDHWDDRNNLTGTGARYFRGDILAHAAFLMAQGGVHQRASRTPSLIPVQGMGRETVGGHDVYKAARIYYRAVAHYLGNVGAATGIPANDENVFRTIRNGCVSAAIDLYGAGSREHRTTELAWYAVGLPPAGTPYGADCTFLTWGADWWMSRPYVGVSSPDWSSHDLFVNNGGASEWNALINVMDGGSPTQFENLVYFRVRNVGDQPANNVQVQFEYTKITAGGATWLPMTDKDGNIQSVNLGTLAAGQSNIADSVEDTPPVTAQVKWWIPPLETGETVDHFCIRARVFSISDVNPHNNEVQSNIAYAPYVPGAHARFGFFVGNDTREMRPIDLVVSHSLPKGWGLDFAEPTRNLVLKPGETRRLHAVLATPAGAGERIEPPYDGRLKGKVDGVRHGGARGTLTRVKMADGKLQGLVALTLEDGAHVSGRFSGRLDAAAGHVDGTIEGALQARDGAPVQRGEFAFRGCLRPDRIVNVGQWANGVPVSGLSIQVQVPMPAGSCFEALPPTDTLVTVKPKPEEGKHCVADAEHLLRCLDFGRREVCSVDISSVTVEIRFKRETC